MKTAWLLLTSLLLAPALAGCIQPPADLEGAGDADADAGTAEWAKELPNVIMGLEHLAQAELPSGAGLWVHGDHAYVSGLDTGFHIVDIRDPAAPELVGSIEGEFFSRDVDFLTFDDGRLYAVAAGEGGGMHFIDVSDPATPEVVSTLELDGSTHNLAVLPGQHYVYNAASDGKGGKIEIVDARDPVAPVKVGEFGDHGCHDITFHMGDDRQRLYCAGIERTEIWDIADPLTPVFISSFTNAFVSAVGAVADQNGALTPGLHHLALPNEDGTILIVGDEFMGGLGPGCGANAAGKSTPLGALWFYDIEGENEKAPILLGSYAPHIPVGEYAATAATGDALGTAFGLSCTAHFGSLIPGKETIAIAWYRAGVILVDFSDPTAPVEIDQWNTGTNTWDVRYANGHLFTGDMNRGLDVLTFV